MQCDSETWFTVQDQQFLKTLLIEIRAKTILFGSYKKKNAKKEDVVYRIGSSSIAQRIKRILPKM